jgi:hypothetical protein
MIREVKQVNTARAASDGAGVKLNRVFGGGAKPEMYDPFLLLDAFGSDEASDYIAGFPSHPHRGFETVTYMLEGKMLHEDHLGNKGLLNNGDVQWMTAARGIIHSEMPQQEEGLMSGFQLWVNLPAAEKMKDPSYRDIPAKDIPEINFKEMKVKVIAGKVKLNGEQLIGAVSGLSTDPLYLDVYMPEGAAIQIPVADGHTALIYVYEGNVGVGGAEKNIDSLQLAVLGTKGDVQIKATKRSRFLVLAGKPLNESMVQHGPFVMNTVQEIEQAIQDYRDGVLTV